MSLKKIDAVTLKRWIEQKEAIVIDVREPAEHVAEKIEGAILIPLGSLQKQALPAAAKGKKCVIHCRKGGRGTSACEKLLAEDPELEVYNLEGGINAWIEAGFAVKNSGKFFLSLDRQVQLLVGLLIFVSSLLGYFVHPFFVLVCGVFGAGLMFAGLSGFCGMALFLARMPWNQAVKDTKPSASFCKLSS